MKIGVDYYPEHWGEDYWKEDVAAMSRAGVQIVRIGEFAWGMMEPEEGKFDFQWLDKIVSMFTEAGIEIVLCTPTCTPPQWMFEKYPEIIQVGTDGKRVPIGIRGHRCMNSPLFRDKVKTMIQKLVHHFKDNENIAAWQIDNELEANFCCCPVCAEKFREYVKKKYKTIEKVNEAYGNDVWSGRYTSFSQINPPFGTHQTWLNPSYMLDFNRFASESTVEYLNFQAGLIREIVPQMKLTTNNWLPENIPDFYKLFENMDFVSYDNYPTTVIPEDPEELYSHAFHLDLMRGIKRKNFWIMEELSGSLGSWMPMTATPEPGMIKGYALQAAAHGADAVLHFRWRTAKSGAEMFWHGLIDQSNIPGRRFEEFCSLTGTLKENPVPEETEIHNQAAILYSTESEYAFKIQPQVEGMHYFTQLKAYHDAFTANGVGVDMIDANSDFSGYRIVVAPALFLADEELAGRAEEFVRKGGHFVLTNRSGVKDENNQCVCRALPGIFADLAGVYVTEYDPVGLKKQRIRIQKDSWKQGSILCVSAEDKDTAFARDELCCSLWCDILGIETADVLAVYGENFYENAPAVTRNHFGQGECYYVGTVLNRRGMISLIGEIVRVAGAEHIMGLPLGVEYTVRESEKERIHFLFNNTNRKKKMELRRVNAYGMGEPVKYELEPFEMQIERQML